MGLTADVVGGATIQSAWGNQIRDRTVQVFANIAERDAQWAAPPDGAMATTVDDAQIWRRYGAVGGVWRRWPLLPLVSERNGTVSIPASGTLGSLAPPSIPGWMTTAGDGTMTFAVPCVVAIDLLGSRGGTTQFLTRCYGPSQANDLAESASLVVGGTTARSWLSRTVALTAAGGTLRLAGMSTAGVMADFYLSCRVAILTQLSAVPPPAGALAALGVPAAHAEEGPPPAPSTALEDEVYPDA